MSETKPLGRPTPRTPELEGMVLQVVEDNLKIFCGRIDEQSGIRYNSNTIGKPD